jgi:hypothetical protein
MRRCVYWFSLAFGILLATQSAWADTCPDTCPTFTVNPSDISGPAGSTVGWGYSITNNSTTSYLDISSIDASVFQDGSPDSSIFSASFVPLAPGATEMQPFVNVNDGNIEDNLGLFQFTWDAGAPVGSENAGFFGLYGSFCDASGNDPNNPTGDTYCAEDGIIPATLLATADYSVTVSPSSTTPAPEPSSFLLLLSGLCAIELCAWHWQRTSAWPRTRP